MQQHGKLFNKDQHNGQNKMAAAFYDFFGGTAKSGHIPDRQLSFTVSCADNRRFLAGTLTDGNGPFPGVLMPGGMFLVRKRTMDREPSIPRDRARFD